MLSPDGNRRLFGKHNGSRTCLVQTFERAGSNLGRDGEQVEVGGLEVYWKLSPDRSRRADEGEEHALLRPTGARPVLHALISHEVIIKPFCKSQFRHKSVNFSLILVPLVSAITCSEPARKSTQIGSRDYGLEFRDS